MNPSDEEIFDNICDCDRMSVERVWWHGKNAGRRYRGCQYDGCAFHKWIDPPLGARSCEAIAELLESSRLKEESYLYKLSDLRDDHAEEVEALKKKQVLEVETLNKEHVKEVEAMKKKEISIVAAMMVFFSAMMVNNGVGNEVVDENEECSTI